MAEVVLLNSEATSRKSFVTVGVPFEKGELTVSDTLEVEGATTSIEKVQWYPQGARYSDNSVKYARCTFPVDIPANTTQTCNVRVGSSFVERPFYIEPTQILGSMNDTQVELEISPVTPVKVTGSISRIDVTSVSTGGNDENFVISFTLNVLRDHVKNPSGWDPNAIYKVRVEGLSGPYAVLNGVVLEGKMLSEFNYSQLSFRGYRNSPSASFTKFTNQPTWQSSYAPSGHLAYFEMWAFTPHTPATLTIDLGIPSASSSIEGTSATGEHYFRTRYFKRFEDHPSGRPLKPVWVEFVTDTFSNCPYQRFWLRISTSYFQEFTGKEGGLYKEPAVFFHGEVKLRFKSKRNNVSTLPHIHLRDHEYQTFSERRTTDIHEFVLLTTDPPWKNNSNETKDLKQLNVLPWASCLAYQGVINHEPTVTSDYTAEMRSSVEAQAQNWEYLFPPFFFVPEHRSNVTSQDNAIQRIEKFNQDVKARRLEKVPYMFGDIAGSVHNPGQSGNQALTFGAFPSYFVVRTGYPSWVNLFLWKARVEWWRPFYGLMDPAGTDVLLKNYERPLKAQGILAAEGEIHYTSDNFGGPGRGHAYSYLTYPEGPLMGPIPGGRTFVGPDLAYSITPTWETSSVKNYKPSHYVFPWITTVALISMDYLALKIVEKTADFVIAQLREEPYGYSASQFSLNKTAREVGRPATWFASNYEVLGHSWIRDFIELRFGDPDKGFWGGSFIKHVLDNPSNFPGSPYDYTLFYDPYGGFDRRALWSESWTSSWMEGFIGRGYYALYRALLDYYGDDSSLSANAENIRKMALYSAAGTTLYGYIWNCRPDGEYRWLKNTLNSDTATIFSDFPFSGSTPYSDADFPSDCPIFLDIQKGDVIYDSTDPTKSGTVLHVFREDLTTYSGISGGWVNPGNNWGFRYQYLVENDSANPLSYSNKPYICTRSNERINMEGFAQGWLACYALHAGVTQPPQKPQTYFVRADRAGNLTPGPGLASGQPLTLADFDTEAPIYHTPYTANLDGSNSANNIYESPAVAPLESGRPKYYSLSASLSIWGIGGAAVAKYFYNKGAYPVGYDATINAKAESILQGEFEKINWSTTVGSQWGGFETDGAAVHGGFVDTAISSEGDYVKLMSSPFNIRVQQLTLDGLPGNSGGDDPATDFEWQILSAQRVRVKVRSPSLNITSNGIDYKKTAAPAEIFVTVGEDRKIVIDNPQNYTKSAEAIYLRCKSPGQQITVVNPLDALIVNLNVNTILPYLGTEEDPGPVLDDLALHGTQYGSGDFDSLFNFHINQDGYSGPTEGTYIDTPEGNRKYDHSTNSYLSGNDSIDEYQNSQERILFIEYNDVPPVNPI